MSENERIVEMCELLRKELFENGYSYGFFLDEKKVVPNISLCFDEEFYRLLTTEYRIQSPEISKREKVATCLDAVLIMKEILLNRDIESKIWMIFQEERKKVHSVLSFELLGQVVYLELTPQSGKKNYGKEILFGSEEEFVEYWEEQNYLVREITHLCEPGAEPTFFLEMLK